MDRIRMTEYLDLDVEEEMWHCHRCGHLLISARENYKKGCLLYNRDPREIHRPLLEGTYTFSPDPDWIRIVEFYCPSCGTQVETEYLPPGHPITHDMEPDIDSLKARLAKATSPRDKEFCTEQIRQLEAYRSEPAQRILFHSGDLRTKFSSPQIGKAIRPTNALKIC